MWLQLNLTPLGKSNQDLSSALNAEVNLEIRFQDSAVNVEVKDIETI
jgi:hypothetical protein